MLIAIITLVSLSFLFLFVLLFYTLEQNRKLMYIINVLNKKFQDLQIQLFLQEIPTVLDQIKGWYSLFKKKKEKPNDAKK